jgi:hypothetical protein
MGKVQTGPQVRFVPRRNKPGKRLVLHQCHDTKLGFGITHHKCNIPVGMSKDSSKLLFRLAESQAEFEKLAQEYLVSLEQNIVSRQLHRWFSSLQRNLDVDFVSDDARDAAVVLSNYLFRTAV